MKKADLFLRAAVHVGSLVPLAVLVVKFLTKNLTINPIQAAEQQTGDISLILILLSLSCTPLTILTGYTMFTRRRHALGMYGFMYACTHVLTFLVLDYGLSWTLIWNLVSQKIYLIVGTAAMLALIPLAITSTRGWMKRLGRHWKTLHRLAYAAGVLSVLHFALAIKGDIFHLSGASRRPLYYGMALTILLVIRIPFIRRAIIHIRQAVTRLLPGIKKGEISSGDPKTKDGLLLP
jgi:methionine sulfoxide reductase heme-binding subunit